MRLARLALLCGLLVGPSSNSFGQSLAERLGYPRDAKLLIVNEDDLGMTHSVDVASLEALDTGAIRSASIMVPCPWLSEVVAYARAHPDADLGLHLTLTNEWTAYRWRPLLSRQQAPSLFNSDGNMYQTEQDAAAHITPPDAEAEVRAQIARARAVGIRPTHLDTHMGVMFGNPALFEVLLKVARENGLPARLAKDFLQHSPALAALIQPSDVVIDRRVTIDPSVPAAQWTDFYANAIRNLKPGVTEMIVHLAHDDTEMRSATDGLANWGAAWRQRDFDFFTGATFKQLLEENGVTVITWREVGKLVVKSGR
jgi:chitin disaccharide deacetylase